MLGFAVCRLTRIQITAHSSFEFRSCNPVISDRLEVFTLGTCLFGFCAKELKIINLHRVIVNETFVEDSTLAGQKFVFIETSDLPFAHELVPQLSYLRANVNCQCFKLVL